MPVLYRGTPVVKLPAALAMTGLSELLRKTQKQRFYSGNRCVRIVQADAGWGAFQLRQGMDYSDAGATSCQSDGTG